MTKVKKILILCTIALAILLIPTISKATEEYTEIQFKDVNLYNSLLEYFERGYMSYIKTRDDNNLIIEMNVTDVESLDIDNDEITDITGIEKFKNLRDLELRCNISNVEPIKELSNLEDLNLIGNSELKNIEQLQGLKKLKELYICGTKVDDFEQIKELTNLERLSIGGLYNDNHLELKNMNILSDFQNLISLNIDGVDKINIEPLKNLTNLTDLDIMFTDLSNIDDLSNLTNLTYLNLFDNNISNIEPLKNLTNLTYLLLSSNQIDDVEYLRNLTNLHELDLKGNKVTKLEPLTALKNLGILNLQENGIKEVTELIPLKYISIDLSNNNIEDATQIEQLEDETDDFLPYPACYSQKLTIKSSSKEVKLPLLFIQAQNKDSIAYSKEGLEFINCELSDDGTKVIIKENQNEEDDGEDEIKFGVEIKAGIFRYSILNIGFEEIGKSNDSEDKDSSSVNSGTKTDNSTKEDKTDGKEDKTTAKGTIPQTGVGIGLTIMIVVLAGATTIAYIKYKKLKNI